MKDIKEEKIHSKYSHDNNITIKDGKTCLNFNCSGFLTYYIQQQGKLKALQEIKNYTLKNLNASQEELEHLRAKDYLLFFKSDDAKNSKYWQVCNSPLDLDEGDLIVYIDRTNAESQRRHCMIVKKIISKDDLNIKMRVLDSTKTPHKADTRNINGIGSGEIIISQNNGGVWNQLCWKSDYDLQSKKTRDFAFAKMR